MQKTKTGELVPRLGVLHPAENLTMLETGEPVFSPIIQEGPVLTEDLISETEERARYKYDDIMEVCGC